MNRFVRLEHSVIYRDLNINPKFGLSYKLEKLQKRFFRMVPYKLGMADYPKSEE